MGNRGPKPKPTVLKLARGTPGHHAVNHDEPELPPPTDAEVKPPKGMAGRARVEWVRLANDLVSRGVLTTGDMHGFEQYCILVGEIEDYQKLIKRVGRADAHKLGYANHLNKIRTQCRQQEAHLGLTPSSRSGVKAVKVVPAKSPAAAKRDRFFGTGRPA